MTESEIVKHIVEGLRSISQGVEAMAKKLEDSFIEDKSKIKPARKVILTQKTKKSPSKKQTATDTVWAIIRSSKTGVSIHTIAQKTGYNKSKIYNILFTLKKAGKIKHISRGVYTKV